MLPSTLEVLAMNGECAVATLASVGISNRLSSDGRDPPPTDVNNGRDRWICVLFPRKLAQSPHFRRKAIGSIIFT
jgi:hypothetical protein